jgi:hypothetical protein
MLLVFRMILLGTLARFPKLCPVVLVPRIKLKNISTYTHEKLLDT